MSTGCELDINGRRRRVEVEHTTTLLTVLREQLDLTGAKRGCNQGVCGACTIAGRRRADARLPVCWPRTAAAMQSPRSRRLAKTASAARCKKRLREAGAMQCGFCTPGMLICGAPCWRAILNPRSTTSGAHSREISAAAPAIAKSSAAVAPRRRSSRHEQPRGCPNACEGLAVGRSFPRFDAMEKATGRAKYIADMALPACCMAPYSQARTRTRESCGYDIAAALAPPGVHAVVTGEDCADALMGPLIKDEHAIAKGKVRYVGEPVAAVAAENEQQARAAALLIEVEYEELPAVLTPEEALAPSAPIIHEDLNELLQGVRRRQQRQHLLTHVLSGRRSRRRLVALRCRCGGYVSHPSAGPSRDRAVRSAGRYRRVRADRALVRQPVGIPRPGQCLREPRLPMSRLRCLTPRVGGGFGNKMEAHVQPIAVMLALKAGRPVKLILSREEDFEIVRVRHPFKIRIKTGAKRDGTLVAREVEAPLDGGAFADDSPGVLGFCLRMSCGPYRYDAGNGVRAVVAYTNKLRSGAFRGFGQPQMQFGGEQQIDEIARRLGLDPIALRRKNVLVPGERWFGGQEVASNGLAECLDKVEAASGWKHRAALPSRHGKRRGLGLACSAHISALLSTGAIVRMLEDGSIVLNTGATDIGQGSDTVLAQICAEALK